MFCVYWCYFVGVWLVGFDFVYCVVVVFYLVYVVVGVVIDDYVFDGVGVFYGECFIGDGFEW